MLRDDRPNFPREIRCIGRRGQGAGPDCRAAEPDCNSAGPHTLHAIVTTRHRGFCSINHPVLQPSESRPKCIAPARSSVITATQAHEKSLIAGVRARAGNPQAAHVESFGCFLQLIRQSVEIVINGVANHSASRLLPNKDRATDWPKRDSGASRFFGRFERGRSPSAPKKGQYLWISQPTSDLRPSRGGFLRRWRQILWGR